jgi:aspartate/tyrosine/aromatic aminotransferase
MLKKLVPLKPDPIMGLVQKFNKDTRKNKINLTIGELYFNSNNEKKLMDYQFIMKKIGGSLNNVNKTSKYLPITGCPNFIENSEKFIFGNNMERHGVQTLSGTGSLNVGNHILSLIDKPIYIQSTSWPNHFNIFQNHQKFYDIENLKYIPYNSVILFHTCCNNPTGIDYSSTSWNYLIDLIIDGKHIAFFDSAYLGLASGNNLIDSKPIQVFENNKIPYIVSTSYAKNFGLYGHRIGSLFYNFYDEEYNSIMKQHITKFIRSTYSNPPRIGAELASNLMEDKNLMNSWKELMKETIDNQMEIRNILDNELGWSTSDKNGLFFMAPLNKEQTINLREKEGIYMLENGRINISGLDINNIEKFIRKIKKYNV